MKNIFDLFCMPSTNKFDLLYQVCTYILFIDAFFIETKFIFTCLLGSRTIKLVLMHYTFCSRSTNQVPSFIDHSLLRPILNYWTPVLHIGTKFRMSSARTLLLQDMRLFLGIKLQLISNSRVCICLDVMFQRFHVSGIVSSTVLEVDLDLDQYHFYQLVEHNYPLMLDLLDFVSQL